MEFLFSNKIKLTKHDWLDGTPNKSILEQMLF
jgi:hypothetical protein